MKREPIAYPPGFFLELVREHRFPPMYEPQPLSDRELRARTPRGTLAERPKTAPIFEATRDEAISLGARRYRSSVSCAQNHDPERYTKTRRCCECIRLHNERSKQGAAA